MGQSVFQAKMDFPFIVQAKTSFPVITAEDVLKRRRHAASIYAKRRNARRAVPLVASAHTRRIAAAGFQVRCAIAQHDQARHKVSLDKPQLGDSRRKRIMGDVNHIDLDYVHQAWEACFERAALSLAYYQPGAGLRKDPFSSFPVAATNAVFEGYDFCEVVQVKTTGRC